jgi:hypothetical protein
MTRSLNVFHASQLSTYYLTKEMELYSKTGEKIGLDLLKDNPTAH